MKLLLILATFCLSVSTLSANCGQSEKKIKEKVQETFADVKDQAAELTEVAKTKAIELKEENKENIQILKEKAKKNAYKALDKI